MVPPWLPVPDSSCSHIHATRALRPEVRVPKINTTHCIRTQNQRLPFVFMPWPWPQPHLQAGPPTPASSSSQAPRLVGLINSGGNSQRSPGIGVSLSHTCGWFISPEDPLPPRVGPRHPVLVTGQRAPCPVSITVAGRAQHHPHSETATEAFKPNAVHLQVVFCPPAHPVPPPSPPFYQSFLSPPKAPPGPPSPKAGQRFANLSFLNVFFFLHTLLFFFSPLSPPFSFYFPPRKTSAQIAQPLPRMRLKKSCVTPPVR